MFDADEQLVAHHQLKGPEHGWQVDPQHHARLWQGLRVQTRDLECYREPS